MATKQQLRNNRLHENFTTSISISSGLTADILYQILSSFTFKWKKNLERNAQRFILGDDIS